MTDNTGLGLVLSLAGMLVSFSVHVLRKPRDQVFVAFLSFLLGLAGVVLILTG